MQSSDPANTDVLRIHVIKGMQYVDDLCPYLTDMLKRREYSKEQVAEFVSVQLGNDLSLARLFVVLQVFIRMHEICIQKESLTTFSDAVLSRPSGSVDYTMNELVAKYDENLHYERRDGRFIIPIDFSDNINGAWCEFLEVLVAEIYDRHFGAFL